MLPRQPNLESNVILGCTLQCVSLPASAPAYSWRGMVGYVLASHVRGHVRLYA